MNCPLCGKPLVFTPHPDRADFVVALCCNPYGPVVEGPASALKPAAASPKKDKEANK